MQILIYITGYLCCLNQILPAMIRKHVRSIFLLVVSSVLILPGSAASMEIIFPTLGNCYLCKLRIEAKLANTEGVITADWNYETKVITVVYDENVTDAFEIMHSIADTGHDTEWYPAPDSMYALLVGTCCEYPRTIDYTQVEIGYLSLMGIWVWPLIVDDSETRLRLSIFPSVTQGQITLDFTEIPPVPGAVLTLFSMNGRQVYRRLLPLQSRILLDLSSLSSGQYLTVVTHSDGIIMKSKLIINH